MSESFKALFEESTQNEEMTPGSVLQGAVVEIKQDYVVVNVGLKAR
jgi:small subunit ribosomal protein S1